MGAYRGNVYFLSQDAYTCRMSDIDISRNQSLEESVVGYLKDVKKNNKVSKQ